MIAVKTSLTASDLPDSLQNIRFAIEAAVPHGRTTERHGRDKGTRKNVPDIVDNHWMQLDEQFRRICDKYPKLRNTNNYKHLGTLGTGNHFIELCPDETDFVWVMLHSGSRGVGNAIGNLFISLAQKICRRTLPICRIAIWRISKREACILTIIWKRSAGRRILPVITAK